MAHYRALGRLPRQRHTQLRDDDGPPVPRGADGRGGLLVGLLAALPPRRAERDHRQHGVGARRPVAHAQPPAQAAPPQAARPRDRARARSRAAGWSSATTTSASPTSSPAPTPSPLYRNAIGDECVYVESGSGTVETVFGVVAYRAGDYVIVPRATDHRWVPAEPSRLYAIEANSHIHPPKRYLSRFGQLLEHAPYCERDLHGPEGLDEPCEAASSPTSRCWSSTAPAPASSAPG